MFRLLLDHHPQLAVFGEFEESVSEAVGDDWPALAEYHDFLARDRMALEQGFVVDPALDYVALVRSFFEQAATRTGAPQVGAAVHSRFDLLPRLFPDARYLHVVRDPRDVAHSVVKMGWAGNDWAGARVWVDAEQRWERLRDAVPASHRLDVHYEDLLISPEVELERVCSLLGVLYDPVMLAIEDDTSYRPPDASRAWGLPWSFSSNRL